MTANNEPEDVVSSGYDAIAEAYAGLEGEQAWPRMHWLYDLLARLDVGSAVLDLGCGNGIPGTREIAKHHRAIGVDISEEQIERARRNVPEATFIGASATDIDFEPASFDAIVCFYMLGHVGRAHQADLLGKLYGWLRPGGYLLVTVDVEERPDGVKEWLGSPMFFGSYDAATLIGFMREAGFVVLRDAAEAQIEGETEVEFHWVLAQTPS